MQNFARRLATVFVAALLAAPPPAALAQDRSLRAVPVGPFKQIEVSGMATVTLVQGDREELSVEAAPSTHARIRLENEQSVLSISVVEDRSGLNLFGQGGRPPRITITFRNLEALRLSGAVKVECARIAVPSLEIEATGATKLAVTSLDTGRLHVEGSGAMKAEMAGRAVEQHVEMSGAGNYRAGNLLSDTAKVEVSGAGKALVRVEKTLDIQASGAGSVDYIGNPKVTQDVSGAARVRRKEHVSALQDPAGAAPDG